MDTLKQYVKIGNLEKVRNAMGKGDFNFDINWMDYNLLKISLDYKHKDIAKFFIENNFRLNKNLYSERDNTPLHLAVKLGWKDIVQFLLLKGASTAVRENINYLTPIELSFLTEKYELTDLMLPFYKQCSIAGTVNEFIEEELVSNDSISIIHIAAARNCLSVMSECIEGRSSINSSIRSDYFNWPQYTPLHFAVKFQSRQTIEFLLKSGADFTIQDKNGNTPLHLAVMLQDESSIDLILSHHKYTGKNPKNSNDLSHFHIACTRNDPKAAYGFLQCGVDINAKVSSSSQIFQGFTALHCAVVYQCTDVVKLLLAHGAVKNIYSERFLLDVYKTNNSELINLIFTSRNVTSPYLELNKNISSLHNACMQFSQNKIEETIASGAFINERLPPDAPRWPGGTALHIAISYEHMPTIQLLLQNGADITVADVRGKTPLHLAFAIGSTEVTKLLLDHHSGLKVNPTDDNGLSHFHIACASLKHSSEIIDSFLQTGVDVNATVSSDSTLYSGYTPLHMAICQNNCSATIRLLEHGTDVAIKDGRGLTAFDYLFKLWDERDFFDDRTIVMKAIAAQEKSVAWFSDRGFTLLHMACILKDKSMAMRTFVDRAAVNVAIDFESRMYPGYRPLHFAVWAHDSEMISLLLDHGADPLARNLIGDTPLHQWWLNHTEGQPVDDSRLFLLEENPFGRDGLSHFHIACRLQIYDIVRAFLDHGINVDVLTKCGDDAWYDIQYNHIAETALHWAAANGDIELAQLLISRGANVNARDAVLRTPLHMCCTENASMMCLLLNRGADVNAEKYNGFTPIQATLTPEKLIHAAGGDPALETDCGLTSFGCYMKFSHVSTTKLYFWVLLKHVLQLCPAGYYVSDANLSLCTAEQQHEYGLLEEATTYGRACVAELERMACVHLDKDITLRDILHKSAHQLRYLVVSEAFRSIVKGAEPLQQTYPIYGYFIELQYRRALKRRDLVEKVIPMMKFTLADLPEDCVREILQHFTDQELLQVLKNVDYCE